MYMKIYMQLFYMIMIQILKF